MGLRFGLYAPLFERLLLAGPWAGPRRPHGWRHLLHRPLLLAAVLGRHVALHSTGVTIFSVTQLIEM